MKNFIIILTCIILGYVLYSLIYDYNSFIFGRRHFKYKDCNIKYRQELLPKSSLTDFDNLWFEECAKTEFIKCLMDKYVISKDTFIKGYVERAFINSYSFRMNYVINVMGLDTTILMRYRNEIFKDDLVGRNAISNHTQDTLNLMKILSDRFYEDYIIQANYFYKIPSVSLSIDTLIKYKEIVFKLPLRYGDA
jgi:hypothetical protein